MGENNSKIKKKHHFHKKKNKDHKSFDEIICPFCNKNFSALNISLFNNHVRECVFCKLGNIIPCDLYPLSFDVNLNELIFKNISEYEINVPNVYLDKSIEDKINELKIELTERKLKDDGSIRVNLYRDNLLKDTLNKTENIEFNKNGPLNLIQKKI